MFWSGSRLTSLKSRLWAMRNFLTTRSRESSRESKIAVNLRSNVSIHLWKTLGLAIRAVTNRRDHLRREKRRRITVLKWEIFDNEISNMNMNFENRWKSQLKHINSSRKNDWGDSNRLRFGMPMIFRDKIFGVESCHKRAFTTITSGIPSQTEQWCDILSRDDPSTA